MSAVLYSFRRCPYAMRARLALLVSQQVCELREVVLARKPAELLSASAKATVPVLVLADGRILEQSLDIMLWSLHERDPAHWLPESQAGLQDALALISRCDGAFKQALDRYKYPDRHAEAGAVSAVAFRNDHREIGSQFLRGLDERLNRTSHLHGNHFGLADAAIAPFVRQFAHTDPDWFAQQPWPRLLHWLSMFEQSDDFQAVMHKYPPWQAGQTPALFPTETRAQA